MKYTTIVKESEWCRGRSESALLLADGTKCCLGFDALRRGYTEHEIFAIPTPENLPDDDRLDGLVTRRTDDYLEDVINVRNTHVVTKIIAINDAMSIDGETRKLELKKLFAELDTELVFVP